MAVVDTGVAFTGFGGKGAYSVKKKSKNCYNKIYHFFIKNTYIFGILDKNKS